MLVATCTNDSAYSPIAQCFTLLSMRVCWFHWERIELKGDRVLGFFSSELGLPHPLPCRRVSPSPLVQLREDTVACGRGGGRVPIPTRGNTPWYFRSRYIFTLCDWGFINRKIQGPSPFSKQRLCSPNLGIISRVYLCSHSTKLRKRNFIKTLVPFQTFVSK